MIKAQVPPARASKRYEMFVVQDIVLHAAAIRYRRERWVTPDGTMVLAPLPAGVNGHFGVNRHAKGTLYWSAPLRVDSLSERI